MFLCIYRLLLAAFYGLVTVAAPFHPKASKWINGRKNWRQRLRETLSETGTQKRIWMHCASLGEFEQGRPLLEALRKQYPDHIVLLSFYSPSGYEIRKNYPHAAHVFYLPADSRKNAADLLDLIEPSLVVFVKYEFWYFHLQEINRRRIPLILVSAVFRPGQAFFKWYGGLYRRMLTYYSAIFVQDEASVKRLRHIGVMSAHLAGDTRYDRVAEIAAADKQDPVLEAFGRNARLLIAGSTWPEDERLLRDACEALPREWRIVIAPHELSENGLRHTESLFGKEQTLRYSDLKQGASPDGRVLLIDNIGMLSFLYRYGAVAYVGGGFGKGGIHNILEPAVYGLPVLFGPNYRKFVEAKKMVAAKYAFPVGNAERCREVLAGLVADDFSLAELHRVIRSYVQHQTGATALILRWIAASRVLGTTGNS